MVDLTSYTSKHFLYILRSNTKYRNAIATKSNWSDVLKVIDSLKLKYNKKQIEYAKIKEWS